MSLPTVLLVRYSSFNLELTLIGLSYTLSRKKDLNSLDFLCVAKALQPPLYIIGL